ncbi:MAG TPA: DUF2652 domain-containing protein, partial [Parafilimonas sp.]
KIGLTISEIEGDAVLFYRFGKTPSPEEICAQVETMFCNFQKKIKSYEVRRACQCSACIAAVNLTLKIITHYGEFSTFNVNTYNKLIGKDVIIVHQLLKNDIDVHEYWLVTNNLFNSISANKIPDWMNWQQGNKITDKGEVGFQYSMLSRLKEKVQPDALPDLGLGDNKIKLIGKSKIIDAQPISVLSIIGDFSLRTKWMEGVTAVDMISHPINHVGVKHRNVSDKGSIIFYSSSFSQNSDSFFYSETDEKKTTEFYFTVKAIEGNKTLVTIDYYLKKDIFKQFYFSLFLKKKLAKQLAKSLDNLAQLSCEPGVGFMPAEKNKDDFVV